MGGEVVLETTLDCDRMRWVACQAGGQHRAAFAAQEKKKKEVERTLLVEKNITSGKEHY
jgi:hypothetical protein